ncbi:MAG: YwaF family protein [Defluviitaleaceae bacterium]|nr:YwaF family protein [Defluviitaleaceae bacterium]
MQNIVSILEINRYLVPAVLGPFHIASIMTLVLLSIFVGLYFKGNTSITTYKKIMFYTSIFLILTEIWRIVIMTFPSTGEHYFRFREFPFQLSSLPMPVMLMASFVKKERLRQQLNYFMATYLTLGGMAAVLVPAAIFRGPIFISVQSIVLHVIMFVIGVYLYTTGFVKFEFKSQGFKRSVMMFLGYFVLSQSIVIGAALLGFYTPGYLGLGRMYAADSYPGNFLILGHISPWFVSNIPFASHLQRFILAQGGSLALGYLAVCVIYLAGSTTVSYLIFIASKFVGQFYTKLVAARTKAVGHTSHENYLSEFSAEFAIEFAC